jgi:hypothetical protein
LVERRLRAISKRLRTLRDEITVIDDQLAHLSDDADDAGIRALVSETPGAGSAYREAKAHADAMRNHRAHVIATIAELEQRQDELLDQLGP